MALAHMSIRVHSRGKGHTAAAAAAYRCGTKLRCPRTGALPDFEKRGGVEHFAIRSPRATPIADSSQA